MPLLFDPVYIVLLVVTLGITGWAAWRVRATYARWSKVDSGLNVDAFDFARRLLDRQNLASVRIEPTPGQLTDHYDPRGKVLRVSTQVADASALETRASPPADRACRWRRRPSSRTRWDTPSRMPRAMRP